MRRFSGLSLVVCLAGSGWAAQPRELEPRPPDHRQPGSLFPRRPPRPAVLDRSRPPPPEYAYWYWLEELEARRQGKPDPWFLRGRRKTEGRLPQPGVALGGKYQEFPYPYPEAPGPRETMRLRGAAIPPARLSLDPGFATGEADYDFDPYDERSDYEELTHGRRPSPGARGRGSPPSRLDRPRTPAEMRELGDRLFERPPSPGHGSCISCHRHPEDLRHAFDRYPAYDGHTHRLIGLEERINLCRLVHQDCRALEPGGEPMVALLMKVRGFARPPEGESREEAADRRVEAPEEADDR